jgi:transcriptional regulator with XRE-family HTH domain
MPSLADLGRLIKKKRGDRGVRAVAKEIGISHGTLSRVERGYLPDLDNYQKICRWLGIEANPVALPETSRKTGAPQVHFRKQPTVTPETASALAQLILTAQAALENRS